MANDAMVQPLFQRPVVSDVQFDYKSGRTLKGWPLECIKAGGLTGLVAYACFYASRHRRPELMGPNQNRIGLDPDFCHIFWSELPGFVSVPSVITAMVAYAKTAKLEQRTVPLTVLDGLIWALKPTHHYASWLSTVSQVELLAGARQVIEAVRETLQSLAGGALTDIEINALQEAEAALTEASKLSDSLATGGNLFASAPQVDSALKGIYGSVPHNQIPGAVVPVVHYPIDGTTTAEVLWALPFDSIAAAWTHAEMRLFRAIPFHEWRVAGWDRARYEHAADGVRRFIDHYNASALWVTSEVLLPDTPAGRAAAITRFIQVMSTLRRLNNFSALFQIATGLRRDSVARLKQTWMLVPPPALERWQAFQALAGKRYPSNKCRRPGKAVDRAADADRPLQSASESNNLTPQPAIAWPS